MNRDENNNLSFDNLFSCLRCKSDLSAEFKNVPPWIIFEINNNSAEQPVYFY